MYKRRMKVFLALVAGVFVVLAAKLYQLQIVEGRDFRVQAEEAMRSRELLPVRRGMVTDRRGRILAIDEPCFDFCLDYRFLKADPVWVKRQKRLLAVELARREKLDRPAAKEAAEHLYQQRAAASWAAADELARREQVGLRAQVARVTDRVEAIRRIVNRRHVEDVTVREEREAHSIVAGLDTQTAVALQQRLGGMIGVEVRPSHKRTYPAGPHACHVVGLTGEVTGEEMARRNMDDRCPWQDRMRSDYLPGDVIGKTGVEAMCERQLRGRRGLRLFRLTGETLREEPGIQGLDVHLTVDIDLQKQAEAMLERRGFTGSIVVLSVGSRQEPRCEVLAMASVPTYDLNRYRQDFEELVAEKVRLPLLNRAVTQRYQPGSTVKPLAALAGLGAGVVTESTEIECRGYLHEPTAFRCWIWEQYRATHGWLAVRGALKNSCNIYFYEVGDRLGWRKLGDWFSMFGLAGPPGTGLPNEKAGTVPDEAHLRERGGRDFTRGEARLMAVGQGPLTATPLHMANAMATIAREGVFLTPMLALEGGPKQVRQDLPLNPAHLQAVRDGMYKVVNERGGTAYKYFRGPDAGDLGGIEVCGKTGTATTAPQRIDSDGDGRITRSDRIVRTGDTAWFAGFAPYRRPQIAFAVCVEYVEGGGGKNAAPIAIELLRLCKEMGYVTP